MLSQHLSRTAAGGFNRHAKSSLAQMGANSLHHSRDDGRAETAFDGIAQADAGGLCRGVHYKDHAKIIAPTDRMGVERALVEQPEAKFCDI
jgi:hypothetical protein